MIRKTGGKGSNFRKSGDRDGIDGGLGTAANHDVGIAVAQKPEGITYRMRTGGARRRDGMARTLRTSKERMGLINKNSLDVNIATSNSTPVVVYLETIFERYSSGDHVYQDSRNVIRMEFPERDSLTLLIFAAVRKKTSLPNRKSMPI